MPLWTKKELYQQEGEGQIEYEARLRKRILDLQEGAWPIVRQELETRDQNAPPSRQARRRAMKTRRVPTSYIDTLVAML